MLRLTVLTGLLVLSAVASSAEQVLVAIDVSRSVRGSEWQTLKDRVVADVAGLPEGIALRVVAFGGSVRVPDLFQGEAGPVAVGEIESKLETLRADADWTFFEPVLADAAQWFVDEDGAPGSAFVLVYSDGQSSLPSPELKDIDLLGAVASGVALERPFWVLLVRPGSEVGLEVVAGPRPAASPVFPDARAALAGLAPTPVVETTEDTVDETPLDSARLDPVTIAIVIGGGLIVGLLSIIVLVRTRNLRGSGPNQPPAKTPAPERTDPPRRLTAVPEPDPRRVPHLTIQGPNRNGDQSVVVALPRGSQARQVLVPAGVGAAAASHALPIAGLPATISIRGDDRRGASCHLRIVGQWETGTVTTSTGRELQLSSQSGVLLFVGDVVSLNGWRFEVCEADLGSGIESSIEAIL